ncbi:MAG: hypothetical protein AAF518_10335 [Spirochaetota bacterium]
MDTTQDSKLCDTIYNFQTDRPGANRSVSPRLAKEHGWDEKYTPQAIIEYKEIGSESTLAIQQTQETKKFSLFPKKSLFSKTYSISLLSLTFVQCNRGIGGSIAFLFLLLGVVMIFFLSSEPEKRLQKKKKPKQKKF